MTVTTSTPTATRPHIDLDRWPDLAPPSPAPVRAAVARELLRRVAGRTGIHVAGDGLDLGPSNGPLLAVRDSRAMLARLARHGKIGFGESYMAREWDAPDLVAVLEPMARNIRSLVPPRLQWLRAAYDARHPATEDNDRQGARRNITRHYDLSNELFALFLDESMTYSSALFGEPQFGEPQLSGSGQSLTQAQAAKIERLLDSTGVRAGSRVLEIGTGWGELALRAAARGAQVTTVTLSVEQARLARRRIAAAGHADAVDLQVRDYRDTDGTYDAVVSVEMIEAVGEKWWPTYFRTLARRLAPGGRIGLQAILMPHDRLLASRHSWTWIHKYIFPGGLLPSEEAIDDVLRSHTDLVVVDRTRFGASYARTLEAWRHRFTDNAAAIGRLGFDGTFRRMWTFYLAYCEAGFRAGYLDVAQLVIAHEGDV